MAILVYVDVKEVETGKVLFVKTGEAAPGKMPEFPEDMEIDTGRSYAITTTYTVPGPEIEHFLFPTTKKIKHATEAAEGEDSKNIEAINQESTNKKEMETKEGE